MMLATIAGAQPAPNATGREIYAAGCVNCHGGDGRGAARDRVGFPEELPDFADCKFSTPETAQDWQAIVANGGRVRAFSHRMPAFGDALSPAQIERVVAYLRTFCHDARWPRGELNLPRPMATEKAFPENEIVMTGANVGRRGTRSTDAAFVYERRIGPRTQWELNVPFGTRERDTGRMTAVQLGDVAIALKHALYHRSDRGTIFSAQTELALPTGQSSGLGTGTAAVEPSLLFAQTLGASAFVHAQGGVEFPFREGKGESEAFWRAALGTTIGANRTWSPMLEVTGARELEAGKPIEWDAIPQMQVSLSKRRHILASFGMRFPVNERAERPRELLTYLIWDYADGGLLDGWR